MDESYVEEDKYYNYYLKRYIFINEGERLCTKCNGKGKVPRGGGLRQYGMTSDVMLICSKCLGDGKIDWVEEVVGKKKRLRGITDDDHLQYFL